jgi:hypothetical protein
LAYVPWPRRLFARRLGGSSGSRCGSPFFPRVLIRLVGLDVAVLQRLEVAVLECEALELVAEPQQFESIASQFAGQPGGRLAPGEASDDQQQLHGPPLRALKRRPGEGVEDASASTASVIEYRCSIASVDVKCVTATATWASQPVRMQPGQ